MSTRGDLYSRHMIPMATATTLMDLALAEAKLALVHEDVPVGAVVAHVTGENYEVLATAHNRREIDHDPTAHAEVLALRGAAEKLGAWRLTDCYLVVTLEPCPMCAGAALAARVTGIVFGAPDSKAGAVGSLYNFAADPRLNHNAEVLGGVAAHVCAALLTEFFELRRPVR
jgi:tRNA(adenine34) deaminase